MSGRRRRFPESTRRASSIEAQRICDAEYAKLRDKQPPPGKRKRRKKKTRKRSAIDWRRDDLKIWFGVHSGKKLSALPRDYAEWLVKEFAGTERSWRVRALIANLANRLGMEDVATEAESQDEPLNREFQSIAGEGRRPA